MAPWNSIRKLFKPPRPEQRERWKKLQLAGKKRFVWRVGVLQWGGFMFVAMTAADLLREPRRDVADYVFYVFVNMLIWPIAGYCFGLGMWSFYESYFSDDNIRAGG